MFNFEPLHLLNLAFDGDLDPAFHSIADPDQLPIIMRIRICNSANISHSKASTINQQHVNAKLLNFLFLKSYNINQVRKRPRKWTSMVLLKPTNEERDYINHWEWWFSLLSMSMARWPYFNQQMRREITLTNAIDNFPCYSWDPCRWPAGLTLTNQRGERIY